jgi:hypothetical protein
MNPSLPGLKDNDQRFSWSEAGSWAWEDLTSGLILKRKSPVYQRALPHESRAWPGMPDSHPSWRPPAMGVLSAKYREPLCGRPFPQVALNCRCRSYVLSSRPVKCSRRALDFAALERPIRLSHARIMDDTAIFLHACSRAHLPAGWWVLEAG